MGRLTITFDCCAPSSNRADAITPDYKLWLSEIREHMDGLLREAEERWDWRMHSTY